MDLLASPTAAAPIMYGAPAPPGDLLPWSWALERLVADRTYWIASTRPDGRPHCRPVWGVWLPDGFWFSTGSLARHNLVSNPQITVHLESGTEVVIVEGLAAAVTGADRLQAFLAAYNAKYNWDVFATDDGVADSSGAAGPAYRVRPRVVFGWDTDMRAPTRWAFADPTTTSTSSRVASICSTDTTLSGRRPDTADRGCAMPSPEAPDTAGCDHSAP